jgi:hypothetical protein
LKRLTTHVRSNAIAYVALFVALGGTSYAAFSLPAGSVGARQLRNHVIDPVKLDPRYIASSVRAWAKVNAKGKIVASSGKARIVASVGVDQITWMTPFSPHCSPIVTVDNPVGPEGPHPPGFADASVVSGPRRRLVALVSTYAPDSQASTTRLPYVISAMCPVPAK